MSHAAHPDSECPVRLEFRLAGGRATFHDVARDDFLIGSVAGCDLRIPGTNLPPVVGLISRQAEGLKFRKLAPTVVVTLNGGAIQTTALKDGDRLEIGPAEISIHAAGLNGSSPTAAPTV